MGGQTCRFLPQTNRKGEVYMLTQNKSFCGYGCVPRGKSLGPKWVREKSLLLQLNMALYENRWGAWR